MEKGSKETVLIKINEDVIRMMNLVIETLNTAMESFFKIDKTLAEKTIDDDQAINDLENKIEYDGLACLALFQPAAIDLRFVVGVLKMITDIERIGDLAVDIAQAAVKMDNMDEEIIIENLRNIYKHAMEMLQFATDAFILNDIEKAKKVIQMDDLLDEMAHTLFKESLIKMCSEGKKIHHLIQYLLVSRHLERVGDHSTNIAEYTIFIYGGLNVKHHHKID